ncbi:YkvA family protein [Bacillus sp. M6-12]|uniref:YkvA family protein n=1 Tax=Bacillus sp. M6-12 TaxID=2054166 RepID=UPI0015E0B260|nr:YkvA family protein [Bacillus sp. M6-12]
MFWKRNEDKTLTKDKNEFQSETILSKKNEEAMNKAQVYLNDTDKLQDLIKEAEQKADLNQDKKGFVQETLESLKNMFELVKAYIKGDYRNIPYGSLALIVGTVLYFVMPADAIPDIIAALGFTDDAAVIAFTLKKVKEDIDKFLEWKKSNELISNESEDTVRRD